MCNVYFLFCTAGACMLSHVQFYATPQTQPIKFLCPWDFFRQEYWSELPYPTPGDLPNPLVKPSSPASPVLAGGFFTTEPPGKLLCTIFSQLFPHELFV